jgi:predicted O-methyltransferase YrrM
VLWFEREVVGALVSTEDRVVRSSVEAFVDGTLRSMPGATTWLDARRHVSWRNQFLFNLALARLGAGVELDPVWNVQLHTGDVTVEDAGPRPRVVWHGRPARIVHRAGVGRYKSLALVGRYAAVEDPLPASRPSDPYDAFLTALCAWIGRHGLGALRWSFYGTLDGHDGRMRDSSRLPLLALLHDLVRSNGCSRVLETGTARGVSTACMAAAVARRSGARVVTFDVQPLPERDELWNALPAPAREAIDARHEDSIAGMRALVNAGERFHAALLDSEHTEEQLWAEFELATQLVHPSGLILAHDVTWIEGLQRAVERIEAADYGVTRLWATEDGASIEERLGLAVIENRRRDG